MARAPELRQNQRQNSASSQAARVIAKQENSTADGETVTKLCLQNASFLLFAPESFNLHLSTHFTKNYTMSRSLLRSTLLLLGSVAAVSGDAASNAMDAHVQDMVAWLRNQGGHVNGKLEIRRADPSDPTSYFGMFATETIQSMEPLLSVPTSCMIRAIQPVYSTAAEYNVVLCDLTHVLLKELKLGEKSHFAPYVKYLLGQETGQIPATWTKPAKELIRVIVAPHSTYDKRRLTDWMEMDFEHEDCIEPGNAFEQEALALVIQRGWDSVLIPVYDMLNHMNDPDSLNTDNNSVYSADGLNVWASKRIEAGEELFLTYDNCADCNTTPEDWGTPELLRDFGFVELYPQKFYFNVEDPIFIGIHEDERDGETYLKIEWLGNGVSPSYKQIKWMEEEYLRLVDLQHDGVLEEKRQLMPEKEWNTIFQYHQALATTLDGAIEIAISDLNAKYDRKIDDSASTGSCYDS
jgi:hypothetical protein